MQTSGASRSRSHPRVHGLRTRVSGFKLRRLFGRGQQGWWYDNSDFSTMFQDSTGVTPVTAVEQPVGLQLDKRYGLMREAESWSHASVTATGESSIISPGVYRVYSSAGAVSQVQVPGTHDKCYEVIFTIDSITGSLTTDFASSPVWTTTGVKRFIARNVGVALTFKRSGIMDAQISNISIKGLPGNHRLQATSASRPTLSARYNLLTKSEQFDDAAWTEVNGGTGSQAAVSANAGTSPLNTATADRLQLNLNGGTTAADAARRRQSITTQAGEHVFSVWLKSYDGASTYAMALQVGSTVQAITVTGTWQRFSVTSTLAAASNPFDIFVRGGQTPAHANAVDVLAWGADLRLTTDTTGKGPAYQRVNTSTDYDTNGFLHYLKYDGVDDSLATASTVDFSATDKMTVFAGVTKLSDAAIGQIAGLGANNTALAGSFGLYAPGATATANFTAALRGDSARAASGTPASYAAPVTSVVTASLDIAGAALNDEIKYRVDGVSRTMSQILAGPAGGGNFRNDTCYFGREGGSSVPLNGREYSNICVGEALGESIIRQVERQVNRKTGAY